MSGLCPGARWILRYCAILELVCNIGPSPFPAAARDWYGSQHQTADMAFSSHPSLQCDPGGPLQVQGGRVEEEDAIPGGKNNTTGLYVK